VVAADIQQGGRFTMTSSIWLHVLLILVGAGSRPALGQTVPCSVLVDANSRGDLCFTSVCSFDAISDPICDFHPVIEAVGCLRKAQTNICLSRFARADTAAVAACIVERSKSATSYTDSLDTLGVAHVFDTLCARDFEEILRCVNDKGSRRKPTQ
jgi:hypothetical protein